MEGENKGTKEAGEKPTYESALERLEAIVQRLESGQLDLDESLELFEEGTALLKVCHGRLAEAELRIERLVGEGGEVEDMPSTGLDGDA